MWTLRVSILGVFILEGFAHLDADYVAFRCMLPTRMHEYAFPGFAPDRFAPFTDGSRHTRPVGSRSLIKGRSVPPASDAR